MTIYIALERVCPNPWQPRTVVDQAYIGQLAADIQSYLQSRSETRGLLQLPAGRLVDDAGQRVGVPGLTATIGTGDITPWLIETGAFVQLAYGHTRFAAFQLLAQEHPEYATLPVALVEFSDEEMASAAWSENGQRKQLTPMEEAVAIDRYMRAFGWTQEEVGERLKLGRSTIANKVRLLKLPQDQQEQLRRGELSERQALALLPLLDLPSSLLKKAEKQTYAFDKPSTLIADAPKKSSDQIRRDVESFVTRNSQSLQDVAFVGHIFEVQRPIVATRCEECSARIKPQKEAVRCLDPACFGKKTELWKELRIAQAIEATGLPFIIDRPDYTHRTDSFDGYGPKIIDQGCERLRLLHGYGSERPRGFPEMAIMCVHDGAGCACLRKLKLAATRSDLGHIAERERKKRVQREFVEPAEAAVLALIQANDLGVWRKLLRSLNYRLTGSDLQGWSLNQIQAAIARQIVKSALGHQANEFPEKAGRDLSGLFRELGADVPWSSASPVQADERTGDSPIGQLEHRFERIRGWVASLSHVRPQLPALRGNIVNLEQLLEDIFQLDWSDDQGTASQLVNQIMQTLAQVQSLLAVVEQYGEVAFESDMEFVQEIVIGVVEHRIASMIRNAPHSLLPALHYAHVCLGGSPQHQQRRAWIDEQITELESLLAADEAAQRGGAAPDVGVQTQEAGA